MIFLYLALAWCIGLGLLRWLFPSPLRWSLQNVLLLALSVGVGIGIASCALLSDSGSARSKTSVFRHCEGLALAAALALGILARRQGTALQWAPGPPTPKYFTATLGVAIASAITIFIVCTLSKPHGDWDAWAIWNLRARFLVRAGEFWRDAFSSQIAWSHPDYPLLVPGTIALIWTLAHSESMLVAAAVGVFFTFGVVGVLITTLGVLRGKTQSFIAGIVLLGGVRSSSPAPINTRT